METNDFTVNDLPSFSPWPARLLGLEPWEQKHKTPEEVIREYEHEKWGLLLEKITKTGEKVTVEIIDELINENNSPTIRNIDDKLELLPPLDAHMKYLDFVDGVLKTYLSATAIVELGAGYGSVILALAKRIPFSKKPIVAGEYTSSGIELIKHIAHAEHLEVEVGHCDFASPAVLDFPIPENAVIFTSFATHYVPELSADFIKALSAHNPRAVVHIEPCYEHCDNTLLGLMRRRYIEVNDYNTNLVTLLHDQQERHLIKILDERPTVFGMNPLLAASVLVWEPMIEC